jgi:TRIAD3 protein (E3 ubiquitin-protein ligase RNF216)
MDIDFPPLQEASTSEQAPADEMDKTISAVLEIIPDVDPDHITGLYLQLSAERGSNQGAPVPPMLDFILHSVFENSNYPKARKGSKRKRDDDEMEVKTKAKKRKSTRPEVQKIDLLAHGRLRPISAHYADLSLVCPFFIESRSIRS